MVFEFMKYGDLAALLQSNDPLSGIIPKVKLTQVFLIIISIRRAGFTLRRALFRKNVGPFNWGGRSYFSWEKLATSFRSSMSVCQLSVLLKN